jgi:hypothetical protein
MAKNFKSAKKARNRKFQVVYVINQYTEGKDLDWVKRNGLGCCDSAMFASIVHTEDGFSIQFMSVDGKTGKDLSDQALFKIWGLLAERLSKSKTLEEGTKKFLTSAWKPIAESMAKASGKGFLS